MLTLIFKVRRKISLRCSCLATNNLLGLLGMLSTTLLRVNLSKEVLQSFVRLDCFGYLLFRFFGVSSGCIAAVMAAERWMALARPFIYHKHITYELVRKTIYSLIGVAIIVTFMPLFGFGAYIDDSNPNEMKCLRYRDADGYVNKAYAIMFMIFGVMLCIVIVACNLFVARVLCFIGHSRTTTRHMQYNLVNRDKSVRSIDAESSSGTTLYQSQYSTTSSHNVPPPRQFYHSNSVTMTAQTSPNEIKFAKLMAFLSISFVVCWMPQMISIPLAIMPNRIPAKHPFFVIADLFTALHFASDPYVYVLSRTKHSFVMGCLKRWRCGLRRSQSDQSRLRTTATEQNTLDCNFN
ncbi:prostaglandin E2 receptor EP2 subtype isoform X2 [Scaptodrosophila lebanonensis]|uniref:Prostaglandin E2 receptor EP2 subtype isoform X2 n=1 Tax=Drosophila lebanonensis TaxID=7225 RepID=A0A6J2UDZ1_DROLE|nr:prostaglandin E2 receptor EP2 subtype isoform X2 [Scaptodrosophila lebanonensis]